MSSSGIALIWITVIATRVPRRRTRADDILVAALSENKSIFRGFVLSGLSVNTKTENPRANWNETYWLTLWKWCGLCVWTTTEEATEVHCCICVRLLKFNLVWKQHLAQLAFNMDSPLGLLHQTASVVYQSRTVLHANDKLRIQILTLFKNKFW